LPERVGRSAHRWSTAGPDAEPNEAIVKIEASGVNFIDVYFREGRYPSPLPFINGQEGAGVVTEVGGECRI
jgi:NADPH2:quinone reductase